MTRIVLLALVLVGCVQRPAPVAPAAPAPAVVKPAPIRNAAEDYARTLSKDVACLRWSTAQATPDAALCDFGQRLAYCRVGAGAGSECKMLVDFPALEKQAQERAKAEAAPAAATKPKAAKK